MASFVGRGNRSAFVPPACSRAVTSATRPAEKAAPAMADDASCRNARREGSLTVTSVSAGPGRHGIPYRRTKKTSEVFFLLLD